MSCPSAFTGDIPQRYDRGLGPMFFAPFAADLANRVRAEAILELAAGTGIVTERLAAILPAHGRIVATDLNEAMLGVARERISDPRIEFRAMDACDVPLPDASFDAVVCQFGLMFFPDKPGALLHAHRVLRPGGRAWFSVWNDFDTNPVAQTTNALIHELCPVDTPKFYQTPFGMSDVSMLETLFANAGFAAVHVHTLEFACRSASADAAAEGLILGNPVVGELQERGFDGVEVKNRLAERLRERFGDQPMETTMSAHLVEAVRP